VQIPVSLTHASVLSLALDISYKPLSAFGAAIYCGCLAHGIPYMVAISLYEISRLAKATSKSNVIYLNLLQNLAKISIIHISKQLLKYQHIIDYFDVALQVGMNALNSRPAM
jgi:hypothetical protein